MAEELKEQIRQRFNSLKQDRERWEDWWQEVIDYVFPGIEGIEEDSHGQPPEKPTQMYDSSAQEALRMASDGFQGYLTPRSSRWFQATPWDPRLMDIPEVRAWFQSVNDLMHNALNKSNFYNQLGNAMDHGLALGTSPIFAEEDMRGSKPVFQAIHPKETYIAENKDNVVDTIYRKFKMSGKQLLERFGEEALSEDQKLLNEIKERPYSDHECLHALFPRQDRLWEKLDAKNKPYASVYLLPDRNWMVVRESGYDDLPATVWRHTAVSRHAYGLSPSFFALTNSIRLNQISRTLLLLAHLSANPPVEYPSNRRHKLNLQPGGMNPYVRPDAGIRKVDLAGNYPIGQEREQSLQEAIREAYHVDFFAMLSNPDRGNMTATQVMQIASEKAAMLSPQVGRIESELLDPLLDMAFQIEYQSGRIPPAPQALIDFAGEQNADPFRFDFVGPMAQLQKQHHGMQTVQQTISQIQPLLQIDPTGADWIDTDRWIRDTLQSSSVDQDVLRDEREVQRIRKQRAQAQAQQQQMEQMQQMAQALKDAGIEPQPGSSLEALYQQLGGGAQ